MEYLVTKHILSLAGKVATVATALITDRGGWRHTEALDKAVAEYNTAVLAEVSNRDRVPEGEDPLAFAYRRVCEDITQEGLDHGQTVRYHHLTGMRDAYYAALRIRDASPSFTNH